MGSMLLVTGPMFSGKTSHLVRDCKSLTDLGCRVLVIRPSCDTRTPWVVSHGGLVLSQKSVVIDSLESLREATLSFAEQSNVDLVLLVDEFQLFPDWIIQVCLHLEELGWEVRAYGLDMTSEGEPFGPMGVALNMGDPRVHVKKLTARCSCGEPATHTKALQEKSSVVAIGGAEMYAPKCEKCWKS